MTLRERKKNRLIPFGIIVKNALNELDMKQNELARKLFVSDARLSKILRGTTPGKRIREEIKGILEIEDYV